MLHRPVPLTTLLAALPATLLLGACASAGGGSSAYPSLDIRESERVVGTINAPQAPVFVPAPASPATLADLDSLATRVRTAHQRFVAASAEANTIVRGASGGAVGTDGWARAQVAVANLESIRSDAMIALADIDRLHVDAHVGGGDITRTEAVRSEVSTLVADEDRLIASLLASLGG